MSWIGSQLESARSACLWIGMKCPDMNSQCCTPGLKCSETKWNDSESSLKSAVNRSEGDEFQHLHFFLQHELEGVVMDLHIERTAGLVIISQAPFAAVGVGKH